MTNINTIDITPIIESILGLIITIISIVVVPKVNTWVKNKLTTNQIDIAKFIIKSAVQAAEQIYINSEKSGSSKKKYVMEYAKTKLSEIGLTFNDKEIEIYLEQAVLELKNNASDTSNTRIEVSE